MADRPKIEPHPLDGILAFLVRALACCVFAILAGLILRNDRRCTARGGVYVVGVLQFHCITSTGAK